MSATNATDNIQHPLSLKVMRVSRPSLAAHWEPFFSSSSALSSHSTQDPLSLQGSSPLQGHPKTLRDLSNAGQLLTLPAAFGAIQLGETFSCCLAINNEVAVGVKAVSVKVEMQTTSNKVILAELGGTGHELAAKDTLETVVSHEIRELGLHVLACNVSYESINAVRSADREKENEQQSLSFRKFYKFMVTNPLSVKTKVHAPRSPTALLSRLERDKVFLEVHIQNLTQNPLWFENIRLEPVDGWQVRDGNINTPTVGSRPLEGLPLNVTTGSTSILHPQDLRQYIYIMTPTPHSVGSPRVTVPHAPGTIVPLGRLDISWRSSMGEPGRLLTSVLSRRIPAQPTVPSTNTIAPPSALPPYLQKSITPASRPRSPSSASQQPPQRISTPPLPPIPQRPSSPLKRATVASRPQSPGHGPEHALVTGAHRFGVTPPPGTAPDNSRPDVDVDLTVVENPPEYSVNVEKLFSMRFSLTVSVLLPIDGVKQDGPSKHSRVLKLYAQHVVPLAADSAKIMGTELFERKETILSRGNATPTLSPRSSSIDAITPRRVLSPGPATPGTSTSRGLSSPELVMSPTVAPQNLANFGMGPLKDRLRSVATNERDSLRYVVQGHDNEDVSGVRLPPPYSALSAEDRKSRSTDSGRVEFSGSSSVALPVLMFGKPSEGPSNDRVEETVEFSLSYMPLSRGFARLGGLRLWLAEDTSVQGEEDDTVTLHPHSAGMNSEARLLKEWGCVGEVLVT